MPLKARASKQSMGRINRIWILLLFAALLAGCSGGKNLHFTQEGAEVSPKPKVKSGKFLETDWSYKTGDGFSAERNVLSPAITGDRVFVASPDGRVASLQLDSGEVDWRIDLKLDLLAGVGVGQGMAVVVSSEGQAIALKARDGTELWRTGVGGEVLARPVVAPGVVVLRVGDSRIVGLNADTGEVSWNIQKSVGGLSVRGVSTPLLNGRGVVAGLADGRLLAADVDKGSILWETNVGRRRGADRVSQLADIDADPVLMGTILYVASFQSRVVAMALGSPRVIWSSDLSTIRNLGVDENNLYVVVEGGVPTAVNRFTGDLLWSQSALKGRGLSAALPLQDSVIVGDYEGNVYRLDAGTGELTGSQKIGGGAIVAPPLKADGRIVLLSESGRLRVLSTR